MSPEQQAVGAGMTLLDERNPGWRDKITRRVDLYSHIACVLGQVFGSYRRGLCTLRIHDGRIIARYGFMGHNNLCQHKLADIWNEALGVS